MSGIDERIAETLEDAMVRLNAAEDLIRELRVQIAAKDVQLAELGRARDEAAAERDRLAADAERSAEHLREMLQHAIDGGKLAMCSWCGWPTKSDGESRRAHQGQCAFNPMRVERDAANAQLAAAWAALGVDPRDAADDPDTAELADSIRVSLQFERDRAELIAEQRNHADEKRIAWERVAQAFREATGRDALEARNGEHDPYLERAQDLYDKAVEKYDAPTELGPPE